MSYESEWKKDPVTQGLIKDIENKRNAHLNQLIREAQTSIDSKIQYHAVAMRTLDEVLIGINRKDQQNEKE